MIPDCISVTWNSCHPHSNIQTENDRYGTYIYMYIHTRAGISVLRMHIYIARHTFPVRVRVRMCVCMDHGCLCGQVYYHVNIKFVQ